MEEQPRSAGKSHAWSRVKGVARILPGPARRPQACGLRYFAAMRSFFSLQARRRLFTPLLFATALMCAGAATARATTREGFVVIAGKDTAAVERAERDAGQIASVLVYRMNEVRFDFRASLTAEGTIASLDLAVRRAGDGPETPAMQTASFTWRGDSVDVEQARLHTTIGTRAGSLPYLNP